MSGPRPAESLARLRALEDARFVIGNTDRDLPDAPPGDADINRTPWSSCYSSAKLVVGAGITV